MEGETTTSRRVPRQSGSGGGNKATRVANNTNNQEENRTEGSIQTTPEANDNQRQQQPPAQGGPKFSVFKMICLYLFISYVMQFFSPAKDPKSNKNLISNIFSDREPIVIDKNIKIKVKLMKDNYFFIKGKYNILMHFFSK